MNKVYTARIAKAIQHHSEEYDRVIVILQHFSILNEYLFRTPGKKTCIVNKELEFAINEKSNKVDLSFDFLDHVASVGNVKFVLPTDELSKDKLPTASRRCVILTPLFSPQISTKFSESVEGYSCIVSPNIADFVHMKKNNIRLYKAPTYTTEYSAFLMFHYGMSDLIKMFNIAKIHLGYPDNLIDWVNDEDVKKIERQFDIMAGSALNVNFIANKTWTNVNKVKAIMNVLAYLSMAKRMIKKETLIEYYSMDKPINYSVLNKWKDVTRDELVLLNSMSKDIMAFEKSIVMKVQEHCLDTGDLGVMYLGNEPETIDLNQRSALVL